MQGVLYATLVSHLGTEDPQGVPAGLEHTLYQERVPDPAPITEMLPLAP